MKKHFKKREFLVLFFFFIKGRINMTTIAIKSANTPPVFDGIARKMA